MPMTETPPPDSLLKKKLNQDGLRLTTQRRKILALLQDLKVKHLSAEDICNHLLSQGEHISLSTVYRTLHVMTRLGILRELELADDRKLYELNPSSLPRHHHMVCVRCGSVKEFEDPKPGKIGSQQSSLRGYVVLDCQFTLYGICATCQHSLHPES